MPTATLTSKGQVTIPVEVRHQLGLAAGDRIEFVQVDDSGRYEIIPATKSIRVLKGILRRPLQSVSIEDMNNAIADQGASAT